MNSSAPTRNRLVGGSMLAAAPLVVVGSYLFSVGGDDATATARAVTAAHDRYVLGGLLLTVGVFLLIPSAVGLMRLATGRGRAAAVTGGVLVGASGAVLGGGYLLRTVVLGMLAPAHGDLAARVEQVAGTSTLAGLPFFFAPLMVIGFVLAGIGLMVDGFRPVWLPVALSVAAVVLHFAPDSPVGALLHAPLAICIAGLGAVLVRRSTATVVEPARQLVG